MVYCYNTFLFNSNSIQRTFIEWNQIKMKFILFLFDGMKWKRRWIVNAAPSYIRCAHEFRVVGYVFPAQLFTQLLFSLHSILSWTMKVLMIDWWV